MRENAVFGPNLNSGLNVSYLFDLYLAAATTGKSMHTSRDCILSLDSLQSLASQDGTFNVCPDTGASRSASAKKSLFPEAGIVNREPNLRVKVANGCFLKVEFIGTMILKRSVFTPHLLRNS